MSGFYASIRQPDVAALTYNGLHYTCYVWVDRTNAQIDSAIFVTQEQGDTVLVHQATVYSEEGIGTQPHAPRVIATGSIFLCFYLDGDKVSLKKSWIDLANLHTTSTWTQVASFLTLHDDTPRYALYDVHTCGDLGYSGDTASADYVVGFKESVNGYITLHRYTSHGTWTPDWSQSVANVAIGCIGVYASATQGDAVAVGQISGTNQLWAWRLNEADGTGSTLGQVFTSSPQNTVNWCAVGICYAGSDLIAIAAEGMPVAPVAPPSWMGATAGPRMVAYRALKPSDVSQVGNEYNTKNVTLQSRPWHGPNERTDGVVGASVGSVHVMLGHMGLGGMPYKWASQSLFVANLHLEGWTSYDDSTNPAVPVTNLNLGITDARPHQINDAGTYKPMHGLWESHITSAALGPQYGPTFKTRVTAHIIWRRLSTEHGTDDGGTLNTTVPVPAAPSVRGYIFHYEAPWMVPHQSFAPADQTANFDGEYTRSHIQSAPAGNGLFVAGGTPAIYDGAQVVESGYCWPPIIDTSYSGAGTGVTEGVHYWTATYEWRDARGQLHRSMPARPSYHDVGVGGEDVTVNVMFQNLTLKHGLHYSNAAEIEVVLYRTKTDGRTFYRLRPLANTHANDVTGWSLTYTDSKADTNLDYEEPLPYQFISGQWMPMVNFAPPAFTCCAYWQNRVIGVSAEDECEIWYSMEIFPEAGGVTYETPRWHPSNRYRFDGCRGVTALQPMDGSCVVFSRDRIFSWRGQGNNDLGEGSSFQHHIVAEGTGCINPKSVVLAPTGIFFQSDKGYYLLTRTLELEYLNAGAGVEDKLRDAGNIRAAVLMEDRHEIRLTVDGSVFGDPSTLVYNYLFGIWYRHTLVRGYTTAKYSGMQDAVYWRGQSGEETHVFLQTSTLHIERPTDGSEYKDTAIGGDSAIGLIVETDWIHLGKLMNFSRLRKVMAQLQKPHSSEMTMILYLDWTGQYKNLGDNSGESYVFTSPAKTVLVAQAETQKVNAFRVRILESGTIPQTENVSIYGLRLEYKPKRGMLRLPDAYKVQPS